MHNRQTENVEPSRTWFGHVPLRGGISRHRAVSCFDYAARSSGMGVTSSIDSMTGAVMACSWSIEASEK